MFSSFMLLVSLQLLSNEVQIVSTTCPLIYRMVDPEHSYCSGKRSLQSFPSTEHEIESILQLHNEERALVNSVNMEKMYWSSQIAEIAQRYAEHCRFEHDKARQRQSPRIPISTGQNLAMGYNSWILAIHAWANEKNDFVYGSPIQKAVVGHYTQMVTSSAVLIGCGRALCPKNTYNNQHEWNNFVCNYVTGQLGDKKPYEMDNQSQTNSGSLLHDCHGRVCFYNGKIDLNTCECSCPSFTSGDACEVLNCSSLKADCHFGNDKNLCTDYSNVAAACPKFCGLCDLYEIIQNNELSGRSRSIWIDVFSPRIILSFGLVSFFHQ